LKASCSVVGETMMQHLTEQCVPVDSKQWDSRTHIYFLCLCCNCCDLL